MNRNNPLRILLLQAEHPGWGQARSYPYSLHFGFAEALHATGGEETALLRRLHAAHPTARFYYEPKLFVYHLVRAEKLSIWWQLRSNIVHGQANLCLYQPGQRPFPWRAVWLLPGYIALMFLSALVRAWCWRDRTRYPYWQNYLYESIELSKYLHRLGMWSAYVQAVWSSRVSKRGSNRPTSEAWSKQ